MNGFTMPSMIGAVEYCDIEEAIKSDVSAIWLMYSSVTDLLKEEWQRYVQTKPIFIHVDLVKGLSSDKESIKFIAEKIKPAGIITTKSNLIRSAKKYNLITIQRIFLIDTKSLNTAIDNVIQNDPHAVEIMPGIAPQIICSVKEKVKCPIIVGGLIKDKEDIDKAFDCGAAAVSLSKKDYWNYKYHNLR